MSFSIAECLTHGFSTISGMIRTGEFDRILIRPLSPILQVLGARFEVGRLAPVATAILMLVPGIKNRNLHFLY